MSAGTARHLDRGRKLLVAIAAAAALFLPILGGIFSLPVLRAQSEAVGAPRVEVATIKPSTAGERGFAVIPEPGGRLRTANTTLRRLLLTAYHLHDSQLEGGPDWVDRDQWNIEAKAEGNANLSERQLLAMLGALVTDRFHLQIHHVTRRMSVYILEPGKDGPKLKPSDKPGDADIRARRIIDAKGAPVSQFVTLLGWVMGRPVLDRTGLAGNYAYHLEWTPDESQIQNETGAVQPPPEPSSPDTIFVAIQDQLGLKLEGTKAPVEVLIIDHAEKPSQN